MSLESATKSHRTAHARLLNTLSHIQLMDMCPQRYVPNEIGQALNSGTDPSSCRTRVSLWTPEPYAQKKRVFIVSPINSSDLMQQPSHSHHL